MRIQNVSRKAVEQLQPFERVFGAASSAGSEDWMRFDVAWPVVLQDGRGKPKRAARVSLPVPTLEVSD